MVDTSSIAELLGRARRRFLLLLLADQLATAACAFLAGTILLLILGTQLLNWYWPAALGLLALAVLGWRVRRQLPSEYRLAQRIDAACGTFDAISTAVAFSEDERARRAEEHVREAQLAHAERLAGGVELSRVFPARMPRAAYLGLFLTLTAAGLFAMRYGVTHRLDLQKPIVTFRVDQFRRFEQRAAAPKPNWQRKLDEQLQKMGLPLNSVQELDAAADKNEQSPLQTASATQPHSQADTPGAKTEQMDKGSVDNPPPGEQQLPGDQKEPGASNSNDSQQNEQAQNSDQNGGSERNSRQNASANNNSQGQSKGNENNSLMNKLRDTLANMMNQLKQSSKQGEGQQTAQNNKGQNKQSQQNGQGQKGPQQQGDPQTQNDQTGQQQGDPQGQGGDKSQSASSKSGDRSNPQSSQDDKSGVGKQDGSKDLRDAAQLAAMGKISELLGKRAQNVQGEVTVEVPPGKQQLATPYARQRAAHAVDAGGESNRDEIPLASQHYIEQYFEQVHKAAPANANAKADAIKR